ncbi:MAG TPA: efflux RND transporter periplasmic adaptor subunit, partial [Kofleriaceae bacterium]|nr:efflux RND transporter periplasmic adaptor subunit [Kofleriaceae bacterium]
PAEAVTVWTGKSELFMEHAPFVVGTESRFLAHVTVLDGFAPLREGEVTVTVAMKGGTSQTASAKGPTRPGIFIPAITPTQAGECSLTVEIRADALVDRLDGGACRVFPDQAAARAALAGVEDGGGGISFLKEQQWVIEFGTAIVAPRELQPGLRVNAEIRAVPDREARLTAATAGRIALATPVPMLGVAVKKGQLLASIQPTASASGNYGALQAGVDAGEAELEAATAQRDRLARLVASDAVPKRRLDDAEAAVAVARARLDAAKTGLASYRASASGRATSSAGAFQVRTPIAGTLVESRVTSGEAVNPGDLLFTVIDLDRVWVTGRAFEADLSKLDDAGTAWFQIEGRDQVFEIGSETGRLVTVGSVIDPQTRTVPIVFEVENPARLLRIGQFATLTVGTGEPTTALAVPESALLQDGGQWIAYVQTEGETFERRVVRAGIRSRGWVEVQSGLSAGEHVVTTGAYDIKLAAAAGGAPPHGHTH